MANKKTLYFDEIDYFEIKNTAEKLKIKPLELIYKRYEDGKKKTQQQNEILELRKIIESQEKSIQELKTDLKVCFLSVLKSIETIKFESGLRLKKEFNDEEMLQKIRDDITRKTEENVRILEDKFN